MRKKLIMILFLWNIILPINIFAYSDRIIVGGETIGIEVKSKGVYVVGFYDVNNKKSAYSSGFRVGDLITKIDNQEVTSIDDINSILINDKTYEFNVLRNGKNTKINYELNSSNGIIKTGLYVKDTINGIGTLSYIDPETHVFASLGHEILESNSMSKFSIKSGNIFNAKVTSLKKSENRNPGEKRADIFYDEVIGTISKNEINGIYGLIDEDISSQTIEVGYQDEVSLGDAVIRTVLSNTDKKDYSINILDINKNDNVKNIFFEITDDELLSKTNGIVQGMSGSPIIQNNKIIGVVNYVLLDNPKRGYGIFIEKMLEEGDKVTS